MKLNHYTTMLCTVFIGLIATSCNVSVITQKTYTFSVNALDGCTNTNLTVTTGDSLSFGAQGSASFGIQDGFKSDVDPSGHFKYSGSSTLPIDNVKYDSTALDGNSPVGSLLGKVGLNGPVFFIGKSKSYQASQSGTLYLCFNDNSQYLSDNSGSYSVTLTK